MRKRYTLDNGPRAVFGDKTFRYGRLIARPAEVLLWKLRNRIILRLTPLGEDPRSVSALDRTIAELTALAVSNSYWRLRLTRAELCVYLAYPPLTQVAIDVDVEAVKRRVDTYMENNKELSPSAIPASGLAYCMLQRRANLTTVKSSARVATVRSAAPDQGR